MSATDNLDEVMHVPISAARPLREMIERGTALVWSGHRYGDRVAFWSESGQYWWYWLPGDPICKVSDDCIGLPIVVELELDRAVQSEIARAFGALIQAMADGELSFNMWWTDEIASHHRDEIQQDAIRKVASILHTAMGGRIPDEVPHD